MGQMLCSRCATFKQDCTVKVTRGQSVIRCADCWEKYPPQEMDKGFSIKCLNCNTEVTLTEAMDTYKEKIQITGAAEHLFDVPVDIECKACKENSIELENIL